jgi:hypothetical protein
MGGSCVTRKAQEPSQLLNKQVQLVVQLLVVEGGHRRLVVLQIHLMLALVSSNVVWPEPPRR